MTNITIIHDRSWPVSVQTAHGHGYMRNVIADHVHVHTTVRATITVNVFFSDFLPPCLISLNNLDSYVYVNAVSGSVGWHSPLVWLGWHHSISRAWIFNSPIIANHAFHPFDTSQRLSLSGDWWWQHVLLRCCFLLSKRQCKDKKPTSVNRNRFCSNRRSLICIQSAFCFDLAHRPELNQTSAEKENRSHTVCSCTVHENFASAVMWALQRFCLQHRENKVTATNAILR